MTNFVPIVAGQRFGWWTVVQPDAGMNAALIGSIVRSDGTKQVTYNGWPLYTYVPDKQPGDTLGEGIGNVWFAVSPRGVKAVVAVNPKTAKTAPGNSG